jgi:hypothetical protein
VTYLDSKGTGGYGVCSLLVTRFNNVYYQDHNQSLTLSINNKPLRVIKDKDAARDRTCAARVSLSTEEVPPVQNYFFFDKKNYLTCPRKIEETREMSSPGGGKVTRVVQPWPKDYHTPVTTMDSDKILRSTPTEETRT